MPGASALLDPFPVWEGHCLVRNAPNTNQTRDFAHFKESSGDIHTHAVCAERSNRPSRAQPVHLFLEGRRDRRRRQRSDKVPRIRIRMGDTRIHGGALILEAESALALSFSSDPPIIRNPESGSELMFVPHGKNRCVRPCAAARQQSSYRLCIKYYQSRRSRRRVMSGCSWAWSGLRMSFERLRD